MNKIVFVVLHYEALEDTKECLDSLLKYLKDPRVQVVAVDNGSPNGKLEALALEYVSYPDIHFVYGKRNLGFARGNNLGFRYAKKVLGADMIILANNDLVFRQNNFIDMLVEEHKKINFDVAGPKILSVIDGKNQNPVGVQYRSLKDVNKRIWKDRILLLLCYLNLDKLGRKLFAKEIPELQYQPGMDFQLHGACMIFANRFLQRYDGLCDKTYMYGEENILKYMTERDGLNMAYLDDITVYHKEGSSTCKIYGEGKKKRLFYYKWKLHGCKQLKKMMQTK